MNKKEVAEIKRSFAEGCGFFTLNRVLYAYADAKKNIKYSDVRSWATIPEDEGAVVMETLKKVSAALSAKISTNTASQTSHMKRAALRISFTPQ